MERRTRLLVRWAVAGGAFGLLFPIVAWLIAGGGFTPSAIAEGHAAQSVLWIVDMAPFVLAGAGALIGAQHARVDAALTATDQQVKDRTAELRTAYDRLEQLMISKDRFVAMVSHEVRNPLTVVMGFAEELRDGTQRFTTDEISDLAGLMADQSMEISNIIEDILVVARADMGSLTIAPCETDLAEEVAMVVRACVCAAPVRDSIEVKTTPTVAWADPGRVRQIIRNLITNAVRYGGDRISLIVTQNGDEASISVCDDGAGIPEEDRKRLFGAFEQASGGPKVSGSIGIGLHVSRTLARAMAGDLTYRYENGHSIFELTLPGIVTSDYQPPVSQLVAG